MKKLMERIKGRKLFAIAISAVLIIAMCISPVAYSYASAIGPDGTLLDPNGDPIGGDPNEEPNPEPDGAAYQIMVDKANLSLGTVDKGSQPNSQPIIITNTGMRDIVLGWHEADPNYAFSVSVPQVLTIPIGGTLTVYVSPNTSLEAGTYTGTLLLGDISDPSFVYGKSVNLSVTIASAAPYVNSVRVSPGSVSVSKGSATQFSAVVDGGNGANLGVTWIVRGASSTGTDVDGSGRLVVASDEVSTSIGVRATSIQDPDKCDEAIVNITSQDHTVSLQVEPQGAGNVNGAGTVADGGSMTVLAAPNAGYRFDGWYLNGAMVSTQPKYTHQNIKSDVTLVAKFIANAYRVNVKTNNPGGGVVSDSQNVPAGGSATIMATPGNGYHFDGWMENGKIICKDAKMTVTNINSDREFTAIFSQTKYTVNITVNPSDTGKVQGANSYPKGFDILVKAEPYQGYKFKNWTLNGNIVGKDREYTIRNINQDYNLVANFEKEGVTNYTITAGVCSRDGVISPAGTSKVQKGGSMVYTITPNKGYRVLAVAVDNVQVGAVTSYSFTNVNGNHQIVAAFAPKENAKQPAKTATTPTKKKGQTSITDTVTPAEAVDSQNQKVMEMTDIPDAPQDYDYDAQTGVLQDMNITADEADDMIDSGNDDDMMNAAEEGGYVEVAVFNEYSDDCSDAAENETMNSDCLPNLENVIDTLMSIEDRQDVVNGDTVTFNVNIFDNTKFISDVDKKAIDSYTDRGIKVGKYFEVLLMKTKDGSTTNVTELEQPMTIRLDIPKELRTSGRVFYIVRAHQLSDGNIQVAVLNDEDNDENTITFTTDRFSSYAIAYQGGEKAQFSKTVLVVLAGAVAVLALVVAIVLGTGGSRKRRRRVRR